MNRYYYTFGDDTGYPFQNGWIIIEADTWEQAHIIFRNNFKCCHEHVLNCSFFYNEQQWKKMHPEENWRGYKCYGVYTKDGRKDE